MALALHYLGHIYIYIMEKILHYLHFHLYHIGTLYSPTDGTIDPNGICTATTRSAKKAGAKVIRCFGEKNYIENF